jgi:hypothetical protein
MSALSDNWPMSNLGKFLTLKDIVESVDYKVEGQSLQPTRRNGKKVKLRGRVDEIPR